MAGDSPQSTEAWGQIEISAALHAGGTQRDAVRFLASVAALRYLESWWNTSAINALRRSKTAPLSVPNAEHPRFVWF
jgi:hypothetical protein